MTIIADALHRPGVFCWFGGVPEGELRAWAERVGIHLPPDLLEFWRITGGGDVFESETILRPSVPSHPGTGFVLGDDLESRNTEHRARGMSEHLFVFQIGAFLSAIDLRSGNYVTLSENYVVQREYASFEDWYLHTLRAEFGVRYGLNSLDTQQ